MFSRLLAAVCLLAVQPGESANVAHSKSVHFRLQSHLHDYQKLNFTNPTKGEEFRKADQEAEEDFNRKCQVVVTVSDEKFLPVKPLDRFCQTTDAATECRLEVGARLQETHARDGDMSSFCGAVYAWFQKKYGMKCPQQCRKKQCKATCMWLEEKKKLDEDGKGLKSELSDAEGDFQKLRDLGELVEKKTKEAGQRNFTVHLIAGQIERAESDVKEADEFLKLSESKKEKLDKQAEDLEKEIADSEKKIMDLDDNMMKKKFDIDKAKLGTESASRNAKRDSDRAKEHRTEEESLRDEAEKIGKEIEEITAKEDELKGKKEEVKSKQAEIKPEFDEKIGKLVEAWKTLEQFAMEQPVEDKYQMPEEFDAEYKRRIDAIEYNYDPSLGQTKELVRNQYERTREVGEKMKALFKQEKDLDELLTEEKNEKDRRTEEKEKVTEKADKEKEQAEALEQDAQKVMSEVEKTLKDEVGEPMKEYEQMEAEHQSETASLEKAKKTLGFVNEGQDDQNKKVKNAQEVYDNAETTLKSSKEEHAAAERAYEKTKEERDTAKKEHEELKGKTGEFSEDMDGRVEAHKAAQRDLDNNKPEIIRLHGCDILGNCEKGADANDGGWKNSYPAP